MPNTKQALKIAHRELKVLFESITFQHQRYRRIEEALKEVEKCLSRQIREPKLVNK